MGMRTTSSRSKMGTAELVGWTMRPWATRERISLMVCTGRVRRIGRPAGARGDDQVVDRPRGCRGRLRHFLAGQVLDGHRGHAGEAVRGGHGDRPRVVGEHRACGEVWLVHGQPAAQYVDVAAAQRPVDIEGLDLLEPDLARGIPGLERCDEPAERRPFGGDHKPDAQQAGGCAGQFAGRGEGLVQGGQHGHEVASERFARGREPDPAAGPVEDLDSKPGLQDAYGLADPRLGDAQPVRRPAEVQLVGEREEDPQLA